VASVTFKLSVISSMRHGGGKRRAVIWLARSLKTPDVFSTLEEDHIRGHGLTTGWNEAAAGS
jgi:hypothetical protein